MSVSKWIKQEKLRDLSIDELKDRAAELKASMFTHRFQRGTGQLDNYRIIPLVKRRYAALQTIIREKQLAKEASK